MRLLLLSALLFVLAGCATADLQKVRTDTTETVEKVCKAVPGAVGIGFDLFGGLLNGFDYLRCLVMDCPPEPTVEEAAHANPELRAPVLAAGEFDFVQPPGGHP